MDEELKNLKQLMATYLRPQLLDRLLPLLCHYAFKDCRDRFCEHRSSNTTALCSEISKLQLNHLLKNRTSCLLFPKCSHNQSVGSNVSICPTPLMPTQTKFAQTIRLYCSPPCDQPIWKLRATIFKITQYVSVSIYWICIVIVIVTWAKAKRMYVAV